MIEVARTFGISLLSAFLTALIAHRFALSRIDKEHANVRRLAADDRSWELHRRALYAQSDAALELLDSLQSTQRAIVKSIRDVGEEADPYAGDDLTSLADAADAAVLKGMPRVSAHALSHAQRLNSLLRRMANCGPSLKAPNQWFDAWNGSIAALLLEARRLRGITDSESDGETLIQFFKGTSAE